MAVDDISGAKPAVKREMATRDTYTVNDIDGARPKKPLTRTQVHDQTFRDVTQKK